jgi:hypothetical protein
MGASAPIFAEEDFSRAGFFQTPDNPMNHQLFEERFRFFLPDSYSGTQTGLKRERVHQHPGNCIRLWFGKIISQKSTKAGNGISRISSRWGILRRCIVTFELSAAGCGHAPPAEPAIAAGKPESTWTTDFCVHTTPSPFREIYLALSENVFALNLKPVLRSGLQNDLKKESGHRGVQGMLRLFPVSARLCTRIFPVGTTGGNFFKKNFSGENLSLLSFISFQREGG